MSVDLLNFIYLMLITVVTFFQLQLVVKWEMVGNKNETDVFCFEVPLKIVDGQYEKFIEV